MVTTHLIKEEPGNGKHYYSSPLSLNKKQFQGIFLLPIYDEFIMGYKDRGAILEFRNSITPKPLFRFDNTIICEGQIIGTWKRVIKKKSMELVYEFFKPLNKVQVNAFEIAIRRLEEFTGLKVCKATRF